MRYGLTVSVLLSIIRFVMVQDASSMEPEIGPFPREKYTHFSYEGGVRGFFISSAFVLPSREWIAFTVQSNVKDRDRAVVVAVGAVHLRTGEVRHLWFPSSSEKAGSAHLSMAIDDALGFIPVGENRFLFPTELLIDSRNGDQGRKTRASAGQLKSEGKGPAKQGKVEYQLWQWDLDTNKARRFTENEDVPIRVAQAVRLGPCQVSWKSSLGPYPQVTVGVRDSRSGRAANVDLQIGLRSFETDSQTYAATGDPCAFAVCNAWNLESKGILEVFCVDPNASGGIRWRVDKGALERIVGSQVAGAAFLNNCWDSTPSLNLMLISSDETHVFLLNLDPVNGKVKKHYRLPLGLGCWEPSDVCLSPSGRLLVAWLKDLENPDEAIYLHLRAMELGSGRHRDSPKLRGEVAFCQICGFVSETELALSGDHALYIVDTQRAFVPREIFRLNKLSDNGPVEAPKRGDGRAAPR